MGLPPTAACTCRESWPRLDRDRLDALRGASYQEVAASVLAPVRRRCLSETELRGLIDKAYAGFDHVAVAPLRQLDANDWLLELFHGPTLAFKDIALQLLGHLFEHFLEQARPVGHDRRRDLGRYRRRRDRGLRRARAHDHRDPASARAHLRGAAPPDDHGRCRQRPQHRDRGHVRRLPGAARRRCSTTRPSAPGCSLPRSTRSTGRGSSPRPSTTSPRAWRSARPGARSRSPCRPAISATSMPATSRRRSACRSPS